MKKLFSIFLLFSIEIVVYGQDPIFVPGTTKQDYLKKSKNQKTAAWVLLGTGTLSILAGSIEVNPNYGGSGNRSFLVVGGLFMVGASVSYFIGSGRNKKKAMRLSFNNNRIPRSRENNRAYCHVRSINLRISF